MENNILPSKLSLDEFNDNLEIVVYPEGFDVPDLVICSLGKEHYELLSAMVDRYNAFEESKWLSVDDQLPPENEQIIVEYDNVLNGPETICSVYRGGRFLNLEEAYEFDEDEPIHVEITTVLNWMPLPQPKTKRISNPSN
jgi:hypothetical protein